MARVTFEERFLGALFGLVVGDALGVPVEARSRASLHDDPVRDLQPAAHWSDDTAMTLCVLEGLENDSRDFRAVAALFQRWLHEGYWTIEARAEGVGAITRAALEAAPDLDDPRDAGRTGDMSNGNGSLMRTLGVALRHANSPSAVLAAAADDVSRLTHAHPRSRVACGVYCEIVRRLLHEEDPARAWEGARLWASDTYAQQFPTEMNHWGALLGRRAEDWRALEEAQIGSSGYVLHTLETAIWCLLSTMSYPECVLRAVNMGYDADTSAAVAGGLAGAAHGLRSIPASWREGLARAEEIEALGRRVLQRVEAEAG